MPPTTNRITPLPNDSVSPEPLPLIHLNFEERRILRMLANDLTYDQIRERTGWSRGKIYALATRAGARKTEARIRERHAERKQRQVEFLNEVINTTTKCDVLDFLDGIPDSSVDFHLTSPPYNLGKPYGNSPSADRMRFAYFHGWLIQVISELSRTIKPGGTIALNLASTYDENEKLLPLDVLLFETLKRCGLDFQTRIVWVYPHGLTPRKRLAERYETILVFSKGEPAVFNPTPARTPQKEPGKRAFKGPNKGKLSCHPLGAHPSNCWTIPNVGHRHPDRKWGTEHPAQFPLALARRAILLYSMPGDLVCDSFSGSGTTHYATIETGRAFVGADLFYQDLRSRRLADAVPETVCTLPGVTDQAIAIWQAEAKKIETPALHTKSEILETLQRTFFAA
jgi:DNA modification methylase